MTSFAKSAVRTNDAIEADDARRDSLDAEAAGSTVRDDDSSFIRRSNASARSNSTLACCSRLSPSSARRCAS